CGREAANGIWTRFVMASSGSLQRTTCACPTTNAGSCGYWASWSRREMRRKRRLKLNKRRQPRQGKHHSSRCRTCPRWWQGAPLLTVPCRLSRGSKPVNESAHATSIRRVTRVCHVTFEERSGSSFG